MDAHYSPQSRSERLIATGRVVLAATSLLAVWLDPSEPAKHARVAYSLFLAYLVYATLAATLALRPRGPSTRWRVLTHVVDLCFFTLFSYFTAGPSSPFFTYFVFSLVCGTVRWQWRGTLWTSLAALAAYLGVGIYFTGVLDDPGFELHTFIIRAVYLAVVAVLLGYLGLYEQQTRREMALLAARPQRIADQLEALVREELAHAAAVLRARRVLLAFVEEEEPWLHLATWGAGGLAWQRADPADYEPLVAPDLASDSFLCLDPAAPVPTVLSLHDPGAETRRGESPLHPRLLQELAPERLLSCPLHGETIHGRLFFLDRPAMTTDDLLLAEIVAKTFTVRLDHFHLVQQLKQSAADDERVRVARDLHDGVLQSFTGIALRLAAIRRLLDEGSPLVAQRIEEAQSLIALEQRDLRFFIQELRPKRTHDAAAPQDFSARISELAQRMEREWDLSVELAMEELSDPISEALVHHVYHIVREGLVNAVRHGNARHVRVELENGDRLALRIRDDGRGFPVAGRLSSEALAGLGPKNLLERVTSLGGSLDVESSTRGAELRISLPRRTG